MEDMVEHGMTVGNATAFVAMVITAIALFRTKVWREEARRLQIAAHIRDHYRGIRAWAKEVIDELSSAAFLVECDPARLPDGEFFSRRNKCRCALSALLDEGRLFLPNTKHDIIGIWKAGAYRGLREAALDHVAKGYKLVGSLDCKTQTPNLEKRKLLIEAKRSFVTEIQDILDVRRTSEEIKQLMKETQETG
jgi:hypothetical protein